MSGANWVFVIRLLPIHRLQHIVMRSEGFEKGGRCSGFIIRHHSVGSLSVFRGLRGVLPGWYWWRKKFRAAIKVRQPFLDWAGPRRAWDERDFEADCVPFGRRDRASFSPMKGSLR